MKLIKDVNFLPDYVVAKQIRAKKQFNSVVLTVFIIFLIGVIVYGPIAIYNYYEKQELKLQQSIAQLSHVQQKVNEFTRLQNDINSKKDIISTINKKQMVNGVQYTKKELVDKIQDGLPYGIILNNYTINEKQMTTSVEIDTPLETIEVIRSLEYLEMFNKISINSIPIVDKKTDIHFNLEFK